MDRRYLAQRLLNEGRLTREELAGLLRKGSFETVEEAAGFSDEADEHPVMTAVRRAAGEELLLESEAYSEYMELFMDSLMKFLKTPAAIDPEPVPRHEQSDVFNAVSQRMDGDLSIVSGILAEDAQFVELAARYSGEEVSRPEDELAVDSLEEFLNVVNGVFSRQKAMKNEEIDLEVPRCGRLMTPEANQQLILRVYADFGVFYVVLSSDEFM